MNPTVRNILLLGIVVVLVAARFWRLDASCLWFDEMFSVQAAEQPWGDMLRFLALDLVHPPLFYALLKLWIAVGGESIFWLRSLPVVFGCLAAAPFILITREVDRGAKQSWWPLLALFLVAVNGSLIKYAQEVRMYTMLMFVSLVSIWLFVRYFNRGKSWMWLVVVNILLVYTHYYGWFVIGSEVVAILIFQRMKWRRMASMTGIVTAAFLPWAIAVIRSASGGNDLGQNIDWIERPGLRTMLVFALRQFEPFYFQSSNAEAASVYAVSIPVLFIVVIAFTVYLAAQAGEKDDRSDLLMIFAFAPLIAGIAASWVLPYSVWGTRHMIIIAGPLAMLAAMIVWRLPWRWLRTAAVTLLVLFTGYAAIMQIRREPTEYVWCGWENLIKDATPKDGRPVDLYVSENLVAYHVWFATRGSGGYNISVVKGGDTAEDRTYFVPRGLSAIRKATVGDVSERNILLLYRVERPMLDDWLLREITKRGYTACGSHVVEYGPSTLFRVEMTRDAGHCVYPN